MPCHVKKNKSVFLKSQFQKIQKYGLTKGKPAGMATGKRAKESVKTSQTEKQIPKKMITQWLKEKDPLQMQTHSHNQSKRNRGQRKRKRRSSTGAHLNL